MIFTVKKSYGKEFFYPIGDKAESFLKAFPSSRGERKTLTKDQISILEAVGIKVKIKKCKEETTDTTLC